MRDVIDIGRFFQQRAKLAERASAPAPGSPRAQGVRLGRPQRLPTSTIERILTLKAEGVSLRRIATRLDEEAVPTAGGGTWGLSSVRAVISSQAASKIPSLP